MEGIEKAVPSVQLTNKLWSYIGEVMLDDGNEQIKKEIQEFSKTTDGSSIPFSLVRRICKTLKEAGKDVFLHEMIDDSDVLLPRVRFPPRNPELEARILKLKLEQDEKEYRRMTQNVDVTVKNEVRFQEDVKSLNRQFIAVVNVLVTVVSAFAFGYKGVELVTGGNMFVEQVSMGLLFGLIVLGVDVYFLLKYSPL